MSSDTTAGCVAAAGRAARWQLAAPPVTQASVRAAVRAPPTPRCFCIPVKDVRTPTWIEANPGVDNCAFAEQA